jgi:hypothetical protein
MIVELSDYAGTDARSAAECVCDDHPEFEKRWGFRHIQDVAESVLAADILSLSARFTEAFAQFNSQYFSDRLPVYEVRVVFDLHIVANEPIEMGSVSSGLIRYDERCIYLRYTQDEPMISILLHEMAHAATQSGHDRACINEMKRLKAASASILDCEIAES